MLDSDPGSPLVEGPVQFLKGTIAYKAILKLWNNSDISVDEDKGKYIEESRKTGKSFSEIQIDFPFYFYFRWPVDSIELVNTISCSTNFLCGQAAEVEVLVVVSIGCIAGINNFMSVLFFYIRFLILCRRNLILMLIAYYDVYWHLSIEFASSLEHEF